MVVHYFTLRALSLELSQKLQNSTIIEVFSQQKNELCLILDSESGEQALCISVDPGLNYCVLKDGFSRAKKNSIDLFQNLPGSRITTINVHPGDRILFIETDRAGTLQCSLYNTAASNIVLTIDGATVAESFKRENELAGNPIILRSLAEKTFMNDRGWFLETIKGYSGKTVMEAVRKLVPLFGMLYTSEALVRAGIEERQLVHELDEEKQLKALSVIDQILQECESVRPTIYYENEQPRILSIIQLIHCKEMTERIFPTVNEAVTAFLGTKLREKNFEEKKKEVFHSLQRISEQTERAVGMLQKELISSERSVEYEQTGHTIMANLHGIAKGADTVQLPNIVDENEKLTISLDPALTPHQNAERFFEKARKAKIARSESQERLLYEQRRLQIFQALLGELNAVQDLKGLKDFMKRHEKVLSVARKPEDENRIPFRVFQVAGGYEVWVGKSSTNNDELTMKYAKPNDIWFHARSVGGSHTVLKVAGGKAPPREAVMQAAAIAAYYSKMRNAKNVPVSYCERKYVRKSKHAPPGAVTLEREEVLFVEPHLP